LQDLKGLLNTRAVQGTHILVKARRFFSQLLIKKATLLPVCQFIFNPSITLNRKPFPHVAAAAGQISALMKLRAQINDSLSASGAKLSLNDFIVKAAALSLRKVPEANASWQGDFIRQFHNVDINVAVNSPVGLMVPFVTDADAKPLTAISAEVKELAAKVRRRRGEGRAGCEVLLSDAAVVVAVSFVVVDHCLMLSWITA
jgi:hypothetical protein